MFEQVEAALKEQARTDRRAAALYGKRDLRGCAPCKTKMLRRAKERMGKTTQAPLKIGAVLTAFNEGEEVRKTTESWLASFAGAPGIEARAFVVDDGSSDGSCSGLDVEVVRHEKPEGVGRTRNDGLAAALAWGADVVCFHDAHMRFPEGVIAALARKAVEPACAAADRSGAIVTSKAKGWWDAKGRAHNFVAWGADLHWNLSYGFQPKYHLYYPKDGPEWLRVPCPMGACYVMSRRTIEKLSAPTGRLWDDVAGRWGFSEQALALKAFLLDVPVLVSRDLVTHHKYGLNPSFDFAIQKQMYRNACFATAALLSERTWDLRMRGHCEVYLGPAETERLAREARAGVAGMNHRPWLEEDELRIFTHLCGRGAPITKLHPDHDWLADLRRPLLSGPNTIAGLKGPRVLQWRPGESTLMLRDVFPNAEISCLEWQRHRVQNWRALLNRLGVRLLQTDLEGWVNPLQKGFLKAEKAAGGFDLITIGGDLQDECRRAAAALLAPGGRIVENPTADALQVEDAERRKAAAELDKWKNRGSPPGASSASKPKGGQENIPHRDSHNQPGGPPTLTVLVLNWRRPESIAPLMAALSAQTVRPRVLIWDNGAGESGPLQVRDSSGGLKPIETCDPVDLAVRPSRNMGCFPRWWLAAVAETEYVCSMDDDIAPADERFLEDAVRAQRELCPEGIVGLFGVTLLDGKGYKGSRHYNGRVKGDTPVDVVKGRFMLLPRRLLARVPLLIPGVEQAEDDLYVNLCVAGGERGRHVLPAGLAGRWKRLCREDARSNALRPGHFELRADMIRRILAHYGKGWWQ